jgi:hypothetical protein
MPNTTRVAPGALLGEDPAKGEHVVRLDRGHDHDAPVRPAALELGLKCPDVPPKLVLRHHVDRGSEALGEASRIAALDEQDATADREAVVDRPIAARVEGRGCCCTGGDVLMPSHWDRRVIIAAPMAPAQRVETIIPIG